MVDQIHPESGAPTLCVVTSRLVDLGFASGLRAAILPMVLSCAPDRFG